MAGYIRALLIGYAGYHIAKNSSKYYRNNYMRYVQGFKIDENENGEYMYHRYYLYSKKSLLEAVTELTQYAESIKADDGFTPSELFVYGYERKIDKNNKNIKAPLKIRRFYNEKSLNEVKKLEDHVSKLINHKIN